MESSFGAWEEMPWDQLINMYKTQQAWEKEIKKDDVKNNTIACRKHESMIRYIFVNY